MTRLVSPLDPRLDPSLEQGGIVDAVKQGVDAVKQVVKFTGDLMGGTGHGPREPREPKMEKAPTEPSEKPAKAPGAPPKPEQPKAPQQPPVARTTIPKPPKPPKQLRTGETAMRRGVIARMLAMECSADDWWEGLSEHEREVYKRAHPRSKYATERAPGKTEQRSEAERDMAARRAGAQGIRLGGKHSADAPSHSYNRKAVDDAIQSSNRAGRRVGGREGKMIHALLKGHDGPSESEPYDKYQDSSFKKYHQKLKDGGHRVGKEDAWKMWSDDMDERHINARQRQASDLMREDRQSRRLTKK